MQAYVVNISVDVSKFKSFYIWLKNHIVGNDAKDIKGMLVLKSDGKSIFKRADIYLSDINPQQKFISIHYITSDIELINIYLAQHAMIMRSEIPEKFKGELGFSRYIRNVSNTETTILPPENQMHRDVLNNRSENLKLIDSIFIKKAEQL